ncbi:hypothetical protein ABID44_002391 [Aquamicrobium ahrensii]|uniref:Uncharacterized protein n=1 Tax=Aquamicrobium ahrensii TaxID=469551 RepID=A0ABV2KPQ3_9HYPH
MMPVHNGQRRSGEGDLLVQPALFGYICATQAIPLATECCCRRQLSSVNVRASEGSMMGIPPLTG